MQIDSFSARMQDSEPLSHLPPQQTALIVVDMVRDFLEPTGRMPLPGGDTLYPPINAMASALRDVGGWVIWVRDEHEDEADVEFRKRSVHCLAGTGGSDVVDELQRDPRDRDMTKRRFSAFFASDLDISLRGRGVRHLIVCGVATNICVRSTVHDAFFYGYDVLVPTDACAATGEREQASTLYDIETHFGRLTTSAEVCRALRAES